MKAAGAGVRFEPTRAAGLERLAGDAAPLEVAVEDPAAPDREVARLVLKAGAMATRSVTGRTWGAGRHDVIDPRAGRPATTGVLQATAWAATCAEADVRAIDALLAGPEALERFPALLVVASGGVLVGLEAAS